MRVWLRSFGESAEVLEPAELRASMLESALRILERYGSRDRRADRGMLTLSS
ncbi:MAG: WYL domain-containing protein [Bacteroidota bacterium]